MVNAPVKMTDRDILVRSGLLSVYCAQPLERRAEDETVFGNDEE